MIRRVRTDDRYLTVAEVADLFRVGAQTVYRLIWAGELPYINVASAGARRARIRIRESAAHQHMTDRERGAA
jgi:excisionase family DNA binding protein